MDQRVQAIISNIKDDLRHVPSLDDLAASVNLSSSRLRHLFKSETQETLARYIKRLRMQVAVELLATTFLNVKEVMGRVGLRNESHFTQDFKRAYGVTPAQYRAQRLNRHSDV
jgi:AraC family transcriptional regulator of arabinose operon